MRISDKMALIDKIGQALQTRFTYDEIDNYLAEYQIQTTSATGLPIANGYTLKRHSKVSGVRYYHRVAEDLDVGLPRMQASALSEPRNWKSTNDFRLFISHIAAHKIKQLV